MPYVLRAPPNSSFTLGIFYGESTKFDGTQRVVSYRFFFFVHLFQLEAMLAATLSDQKKIFEQNKKIKLEGTYSHFLTEAEGCEYLARNRN